MFKNDYGNKINEKDKKNNIDTDDLENLYQLLIKKNKDDNEKKYVIFNTKLFGKI